MKQAKTKTLHLVCNAHLDPVWLWPWQEGAAEAISTFRTAADFCEQYDGLVFNHNEVILYKWVAEYEPALFKRIQKLVKQGKWHIMGGWYLQPDCNMPSGESFVRQILVGRQYFKKYFNQAPTTAINFDPFGHSRGLVQILAKSGHDSYLFCRPDPDQCQLPADQFVWVGYDGSQIIANRASDSYLSLRGTAAKKIETWIEEHPNHNTGIVLWGIGNHGGGPSHIDMKQIASLMRKTKDWNLQHSTPEAYFQELKKQKDKLPRHDRDINPFSVGCYTSQVRIKQKHRKLENEIYATEKMASAATAKRLMIYPRQEIDRAVEDLLFGQFHDILPGSSIEQAEENALELFSHGLEAISRIKMRAFFALASDQKKAKTGEIPILVYNPHPYPVRQIVCCEFQLADQNWDDTYTQPIVYHKGKPVPCQAEKEQSNLNLDWRKNMVFEAVLQPSQINRFDCRLKVLPAKPKPALKPKRDKVHFKTRELDVVINTRTGLVDRYRVDGQNMLREKAFELRVIADNADAWGMTVDRFRKVVGRFKLLSKTKAAQVSGLDHTSLTAVRVIEDGPVRTVVEAMFGYNDSFATVHYKLPKHGTKIDVHIRVHWLEKNKMLKLAVPTQVHPDTKYQGQTAYGTADLPTDGREAVAQKWVCVSNRKKQWALSCINVGSYGSDFDGRELRLSLLRSPAYSGHPIDDRPIVPQDRSLPRIDQGEFQFEFQFNAAKPGSHFTTLDREALAMNEKPFALSFFPAGKLSRSKPWLTLSDSAVQVAAVKLAESSNDLIVRLFEPTGRKRKTTLRLTSPRLQKTITLNPFEIKTLKINLKTARTTETNLIEQPI